MKIPKNMILSFDVVDEAKWLRRLTVNQVLASSILVFHPERKNRMKYKLVKLQDVDEKDMISADRELSDSDKIAFVVGLNSGVIKEEDFLWFGLKDNYIYLDRETWVIQQVEEQKEE